MRACACAAAAHRRCKALDRSGNVIQIDSFSKIAFPGLRVGWCIGPESVIERLRLVKQSTDLHTDQLAQAALGGIHAPRLSGAPSRKACRRFTGSGSKRWKWRSKSTCPKKPRGRKPEGGMCLWVTLPPGFDAGELLIHARERGVLFVPGRYFYLAASAAEYAAAGLFRDRRKENRARHSDSWRLAQAGAAQSGSAVRVVEAGARVALSLEHASRNTQRNNDRSRDECDSNLARKIPASAAAARIRAACSLRSSRTTRRSAFVARFASARNIRAGRDSFTAESSPRFSTK